MHVQELQQSLMVVLLSSPCPVQESEHQSKESCSNKSDFLFFYLELHQDYSTSQKNPNVKLSKSKQKRIFHLLFWSQVCSTFTFSTEPLPRKAHDDNDFALRPGQF